MFSDNVDKALQLATLGVQLSSSATVINFTVPYSTTISYSYNLPYNVLCFAYSPSSTHVFNSTTIASSVAFYTSQSSITYTCSNTSGQGQLMVVYLY